VVAVQVGQADDADAARRDAGEGHLPLGALAGGDKGADNGAEATSTNTTATSTKGRAA